jgi:hypothetical protein
LRSDFDSWLIENYGFEHGEPIKNEPPLFLTPDGTFSVEWHEVWLEERRREYEAIVDQSSTRRISDSTEGG